MIGLIAREPVEARKFIEEITRQARFGVHSPHSHGYGIAIWRGGEWMKLCEQRPVWEGAASALAEVSGTAIVLHARLASEGMPVNLNKLHPFFEPEAGGPGTMFCHNGTLLRHDRLKPANGSWARGADATDSEKYFEVFARHHAATGSLDEGLRAAVNEILAADTDPTSLNTIVTNGAAMLAYKGKVLTANTHYHTLYAHADQRIAVVSTEKFDLGDGVGEWVQLQDGEYRRIALCE
jgi:predicted glutamine amidotransferase